MYFYDFLKPCLDVDKPRGHPILLLGYSEKNMKQAYWCGECAGGS